MFVTLTKEQFMIQIRQKVRLAFSLLAFALLAPLGAAHAVPITGGVTRVQLLPGIANAVIGAGVTPSATGTGTFDLGTLTFNFPITGGNLVTPTIPGSTIEHNGSGIRFAAGTVSIEIGNFLIDTTSLIISGSARSVNPATGAALNVASGVPLFALGVGTNTTFPFTVSLTAASAAALNATFGVTLFTPGLQIGNASTAPSVAAVPEPAAIVLLGLGAAGIYAARRKRPAVSVAYA
jgi:PEP-CTERM motif